MVLAFVIATLGYGLMLVAMTYVVVAQIAFVAHGRHISLPFVWVWELGNSYLVGSILRQFQIVTVRRDKRVVLLFTKH